MGQISKLIRTQLQLTEAGERLDARQGADARVAAVEDRKLRRAGDFVVDDRLLDAVIESRVGYFVICKQWLRRKNYTLVDLKIIGATTCEQ